MPNIANLKNVSNWAGTGQKTITFLANFQIVFSKRHNRK